jgi:hypothetical protein
VLQAWADRNGTSPADWKVIEIDSGNEMPSNRPSYASASGEDPLWLVYLRTNMARSVEVRAPDEESALAAAKQADPDSFPNFVTINDVMISSVNPTGSENFNQYQIVNQNNQEVAVGFAAANDEAALARLDQYQRSHPDESYVVQTADGIQIVGLDIEQNSPQNNNRSLPPNNPRGNWVVLGPNGDDVLYRFDANPNTRNEAERIKWSWCNANGVSDPDAYRLKYRATEYVTPPGQFTGQWRVLDPQGREVYRFGGIGNMQADANRAAIDWLQNNGYDPAEYSVLPIVS